MAIELTTILIIAAVAYTMELPFRYLAAFAPLSGRPLYLVFALVCGCAFMIYDCAKGVKMAFRTINRLPTTMKGARP